MGGRIVDPDLSRLWLRRDIEPMKRDPGAYQRLGIRLRSVDFPVLIVEMRWGGEKILLHVEADDYDYRPVRGWWVDEDDRPLPRGRVPVGNGFQQAPNPYGQEASWLCFEGWREYHDHQSHQGAPRHAVRGAEKHRLPGILVQLQSDIGKPGVSAP